MKYCYRVNNTRIIISSEYSSQDALCSFFFFFFSWVHLVSLTVFVIQKGKLEAWRGVDIQTAVRIKQFVGHFHTILTIIATHREYVCHKKHGQRKGGDGVKSRMLQQRAQEALIFLFQFSLLLHWFCSSDQPIKVINYYWPTKGN